MTRRARISDDHLEFEMLISNTSAAFFATPSDINLAELFPWTRHRLLVERLPVRVSRMEDLPPETEVEAEIWNQMQIQSALTLSIERPGIINGMIWNTWTAMT